MKCVEARGRETPGFFCLIMSFQQRGFGRGTSTGGFGRVLQQGYINGGFNGGLRQGLSERALRQGRFNFFKIL